MSLHEFIFRFFLVFIPIFVAIDIFGILPLYLSIVHNVKMENRTNLAKQSVLTAILVGMGFLFFGRPLFNYLGITEADFKIAGGFILLVFAISDLLFPGKTRLSFTPDAGIVPIGTPLIVGPAVLTTLILMVDIYGYWLTSFSLILNLLIVWFVLKHSEKIYALLGTGGTRATAKVISLLLAAIAVMMIRVGVGDLLSPSGFIHPIK